MHHRTLVGMVVCVACLWGMVQSTGAVVQYTVTDLTGVNGNAYAINNSGQVVGSIRVGGVVQAFVWSNGAFTTLPSLGGDATALAINDSGMIAGWGYGSYLDEHALVWTNGTVQDIKGTGGAGLQLAAGINNAGQVTAWSATGGYVWHNGSVTSVGIERPYAINEAGQVVGGKYAGQVDASGSPVTEPALWDHGTLTLLGSLGGRTTQAKSINNHGQIVGDTALASAWSAFLWEDGTMQGLPLLPSSGSFATDINDSGQVVGYRYPEGSFASHAWLFSDGISRDLNDLIPAESGWDLGRAYGINDFGQIVGAGMFNGQYRAFLLTPVPEPTTILLLLTCACTFNRRKW